jgi:archaeosine synthase
MSKIFDVTRRDGPARLGRMKFGYDKLDAIETPYILSSQKERWVEQLSRQWQFSSINHTVLPSGMKVAIIGNEPVAQSTEKADLYIISKAIFLGKNSDAFVRTVTDAREKVPPDTAIYAPALATPSNLSMLVYAGVDVVDDVLCRVSGYNDVYMTLEGEVGVDPKELEELPCSCKVCASQKLKDIGRRERFPLLAEHNFIKLSEESRKIKGLIRSGRMREYVEKQCRMSAWQVEVLRLLDAHPTYMERRAPVARECTMLASSMETLRRAEIRRFAERIITRFSSDRKVLVLLPCSARKPYSHSPSHRKFIQALGKYRDFIQEMIITSPLGVVPRELEMTYPAAHYDVPVTGYWDAEERKWVESCLESYLQKNKHEHIIGHLDGAYREVCERVASILGIEIEYTAAGRVTSPESLKKLGDAVERKCQMQMEKKNYVGQILMAVADYQFGKGTGEKLLGSTQTRFHSRPVYGAKGIATLNKYGLLSLTLAGAKRLKDMNSYRVEIDDFVPVGSILAPGVINADENIRMNDEVLVYGRRVFGVGRAVMSGWEMVSSERGVAVKMRYIEEI